MTNQIHGEFTFCPVCFPIIASHSDDDGRAFAFTRGNTQHLSIIEDGVDLLDLPDRIMKIVVSAGRPGLLLFQWVPKAAAALEKGFFDRFETCDVHMFEPLLHMRYAPRARIGAGGGPWVEAWRAKMTQLEALFAEYPENGGYPRLTDHFLAEVTHTVRALHVERDDEA